MAQRLRNPSRFFSIWWTLRTTTEQPVETWFSFLPFSCSFSLLLLCKPAPHLRENKTMTGRRYRVWERKREKEIGDGPPSRRETILFFLLHCWLYSTSSSSSSSITLFYLYCSSSFFFFFSLLRDTRDYARLCTTSTGSSISQINNE